MNFSWRDERVSTRRCVIVNLLGACVLCIGTAIPLSAEEGSGRELIHADAFMNLDPWENFSASVETRDGALLLGTSRDGFLLKKDVPNDLLIEFMGRSLIWKEGTFGCGFRVLLRARETVKGVDGRPAKHDFYDVQFHPTPDVPNWGGYRHILVFKQVAGADKNTQTALLQRRWPEAKAGEWYHVRILLEGNRITAWVDGEEVFTVVDPENSFPSGRFGLAGYRSGNHAWFKDLKIWAIHGEKKE